MSTRRDKPLADRPAEVAVSAPELLAKGYLAYERYRLTLTASTGAPLAHTRDVLRGGKVVAVLAVDRSRDEVVLIRQFRLAAHLANGRGDLVEIVAGRVERGEQARDAARRECLEEIGVAPQALVELLTVMPTPGLIDEEITVFLGLVDAAGVPERAGAPAEQEETRPLRVPIDAALAALAAGTMRNGMLVVALQWLALNRHRLDEVMR